MAAELDHVYSNAAVEDLRHLPNDESMCEISTKWWKEHNGTDRENIDHFLFDHLLLCLSRLNDLLGTLLLRLKMCSLISARTPVLEESDFGVPTLTVGNVVVSAYTATSMQALPLVHIATSLVSRARQLRERIALTLADTR